MQMLSHEKNRKMLEIGKEALFIIIYYYLYYIYRSLKVKSFHDEKHEKKFICMNVFET